MEYDTKKFHILKAFEHIILMEIVAFRSYFNMDFDILPYRNFLTSLWEKEIIG